MRFMTLVKSAENAGPPPPALMAAIAEYGTEAATAGSLVLTGGLASSQQGARVRLTGGRITATDGPFTEAKEVIGGFAIYDVGSREEAIEAARRFMELHQQHWPGWEGEVEVRQIFGPEDFGPAV